MQKRSLLITAFLTLLASNEALAGTTGLYKQGEVVFNRWCVDCHGAQNGHYGDAVPGTDALAAKYQGALPAVLTERRDLTPALINYFVRNGISVMPFFRKTEISDAELEALAAYLVPAP